MPTGYTAGILDGEITTFQQFAKLCMRNFGATMHMRDEPMDKEYVPREPSTYYQEKIAETKARIEALKTMSDEQVVAQRYNELIESKTRHQKSIEKINIDKERLVAILQDVSNYTPPTTDHVGVKLFMIDQIKQTLGFDCDPNYHEEQIMNADEQLKRLDANAIRSDITTKAEKDIAYYTEEWNKDVKRCEDSNAWVNTFLKSLT